MTRIVLKIGSSSLTTAQGGLNPARLDALVQAVSDSLTAGNQIVVVSSGAIAAGLAPLNLQARPSDLATQQAAASVGQGLLMRHYADAFGSRGHTVGQVLLTVDDVTRRGHYRNAYQTFAKLLEMSVVPIVNENDTVGTNEIKFGDNDRLAALVAHLVHADRLVLLSDVDGLYDRSPNQPGANKISIVSSMMDLSEVDIAQPSPSKIGTGGMVTKIDAARIATEAGIEVTLTSADHAAAALAGEAVGTRFLPTGKRRTTRLLWLAHASEVKGSIRVDAGAVVALTTKNASLLPAGVIGVDGDFAVGDPVDVVGPDGELIARGLSNYDAAEVPKLMGRSTRELAEVLGADYERELIHRDDLALI